MGLGCEVEGEGWVDGLKEFVRSVATLPAETTVSSILGSRGSGLPMRATIVVM